MAVIFNVSFLFLVSLFGFVLFMPPIATLLGISSWMIFILRLIPQCQLFLPATLTRSLTIRLIGLVLTHLTPLVKVRLPSGAFLMLVVLSIFGGIFIPPPLVSLGPGGTALWLLLLTFLGFLMSECLLYLLAIFFRVLSLIIVLFCFLFLSLMPFPLALVFGSLILPFLVRMSMYGLSLIFGWLGVPLLTSSPPWLNGGRLVRVASKV